MIKYFSFLLLVLFVSEAYSAQNLRSIQVKQGDCSTMEEGWRCYDNKSLQEIDDSMKNGIDCQVKLKKADDKILSLSKNYYEKNQETKPPKLYQKKWVQITLGVLVGFGFGVGVGSMF